MPNNNEIQNGGRSSKDTQTLSEKNLSADKDTRISLVVNRAGTDESAINLRRVFHNIKATRRLYGWVVLLCMLIGFCWPVLQFQLNKAPLTVYSVVTLDYMVYDADAAQNGYGEGVPVTDLTAPDGTALNLNQVVSAYVLQQALNNLTLSQPITLSNLSKNISIQRILTDNSKRQQEILASMVENKSAEVYSQMANIKNEYTNTFIVSLSNGFGDEEATTKLYLKDDELRLLLDQILIEYNNYLVLTYQDMSLPDDAVSVVDLEELDIPESVDQFRAALKSLYSYCEGRPEEIKSYRSWQTGYSLYNLMEKLNLLQEVDIEYMSSYVFANGIARDRDEVIDNYRYNLLTAETELKEINENIDAITLLLDNYKNDEILVSSQDSDTMQTAITNTNYYNNLLMQQAENEKKAAAKEEEITEIQTRIAALNNARNTVTQEETDAAQEELVRLAGICQEINDQIRAHMEEIFASSFYNTMAEHSIALGKSQSFLESSLKDMIVGLVVGAIIGCLIWFVAGLVPEITQKKEKDDEPAEERCKEVNA